MIYKITKIKMILVIFNKILRQKDKRVSSYKYHQRGKESEDIKNDTIDDTIRRHPSAKKNCMMPENKFILNYPPCVNKNKNQGFAERIQTRTNDNIT